MPSTNDPSLEELRTESERTREALASTVGELRDRVGDSATELKTLVSPAHIKQEITDYASRERKSFVASVQRKATENPLQLAAVGAALAYPAWGLLRAIPTPLLLIGAGLFLTSKKGQRAAKDATAKIGEVVQQGADRVVDATASIRSDVEDRVAGARYGAEEIRDNVASAAGAAVDKARATFQDATGAVKAAAGTLTGKSADAATGMSAAVQEGSAALKESAEPAKDRATTAATTSRDSIISFVNDNALLVAGIGAAVGALIAASIPASEAENQLFGAGSEKLKDKAREAAAQGIERAGDIAAEAAGSVAAAAAREGLDASGVQHALNTVADGVRAVADRGLDTALGAAPKPSQQPLTERTPS
jgi:uncharacterized protein YjbJ (UPF0337 family)